MLRNNMSRRKHLDVMESPIGVNILTFEPPPTPRGFRAGGFPRWGKLYISYRYSLLREESRHGSRREKIGGQPKYSTVDRTLDFSSWLEAPDVMYVAYSGDRARAQLEERRRGGCMSLLLESIEPSC